MSRLEKLLAIAEINFRQRIQSEVADGMRVIPSPNGNREILVTKQLVRGALNTFLPSGKSQTLVGDFLGHVNELQSYIPLCSSPGAFRAGWDLRTNALGFFDAESLASDGAQLIPVNNGSRVLQCIQQGVELGIEKRFVFAIRHSEGNYEDNLDDLGRFTYQPPADVTGMLRYRWCEYLQAELGIPYVVLAVMWFAYPVNNALKQVFVIAPAKIIPPDVNASFNDRVEHPLQLQLVHRSAALSSINLAFALNDSTLETEVRSELSASLAREWSYDNVNSSSKGLAIKRWARVTGKTCPGHICGQKPFSEIQRLGDIAFGHIISQKWSNSFTFLLDKVHHPDNLYLTCKKCNSSLSHKFPDLDLRDEITKRGTIGDWLRSNEKAIRSA